MQWNIGAVLLLIILATFSQIIVRIGLLKNAYETGNVLAKTYAAEETGKLSVYKGLLSFGASVADNHVSKDSSEAELNGWMARYFKRLEDVVGEDVATPYLYVNGKLIDAKSARVPTFSVEEREWYKKAIEADGEIISTDLYQDIETGRLMVTIAKKCEKAGVVIAIDLFADKFKVQFESMSLPESTSFFLCDSAGRIIYRQTSSDMEQEVAQKYVNEIIDLTHSGELLDYDDFIVDPDGGKRAVFVSDLDNGWMTLVTISHEAILGDMYHLDRILIIICLIFILITVVFTIRDAQTNLQIQKKNDAIQILGNSYYAIYRINYKKNTYEIVKSSDYIRGKLPMVGDYDLYLKTLENILEEEDYEEYIKCFSRDAIQNLVDNEVQDFGGDFRRKFGDDYQWVNVRVLYDATVSEEEVVLCYRNVEKEKERQLREFEFLEQTLDAVRKSEEEKQSFFSNMSHDMRTPLNAIVGLTELAEKNLDDSKYMKECLDRIDYSSKQLMHLINDILDMSRMEQGKVIVNNQQFNIRECVENCVSSFRLQAEKEKKRLDVDIRLQTLMLMGDPFRLSQILNNLLSNALKFSTEGGWIKVEVLQFGSGDYPKYKFVVRDNGIGMSQEYLKHIFEPYFREQKFRGNQISGTGLGMPIVKNLVSQMNGEIRVESRLGEGTTFTVILPFVKGQEKEEDTEKEKWNRDLESLRGLQILLAEDNEINMEITTELLKEHGVSVTQAWNGKEALDIFERSEPFFFDAVLMDMQMPVMDGCEATRRIRSLKRNDAKRMPILAVTANAFAEDIAKTAEAGMDAHVAKPIDFKGLCGMLNDLIRRQ